MINILLVEDQTMDARLTQMAFKKAGMEEALTLATDGAIRVVFNVATLRFE